MTTPYVLVDPGAHMPPGRLYWTSPEMDRPTFHTAEVARVFFGRSSKWMKRALSAQFSVSAEDGDVRPVKGSNGYYIWRLYDIERMAHALAANRLPGMTGQRLELVITVVHAVARMQGLVA